MWPPRRGAGRSAPARRRARVATARTTAAERPRPPRSRPSRDHPGGLARHRRVALLDDPLLRDLAPDELAPHAAAAEHDHAVADRRQLLVVGAGADDQHAALLGRTADQLVDL